MHDSRTGQVKAVAGSRPRQLHIYCDAPAGTGPARVAGLRASLVTDLVRRAAELGQLRVTAWIGLPGGADGFARALRAACDALNIYPLEPTEALPDSPDISISAPAADGSPGADTESTLKTGPGAGGEHATEVLWVRTGQTTLTGEATAAVEALAAARAGGALLTTTNPELGELDPLALRFAFLCEHYRTAIRLTWQTLAAAGKALHEWRALVADWASWPSQPMTADYLREVLAAVSDDLDTPAALARLRALSTDDSIAPGSKFETFVYLDRLLGLDLAREIGR